MEKKKKDGERWDSTANNFVVAIAFLGATHYYDRNVAPRIWENYIKLALLK